MPKIFELDYIFPKDILLEEFDKLLKGRYEIQESGREDQFDGFWLLFSNDVTEKIAKQFIDYYDIPTNKYIVNFLLIEAGKELPWHADQEGSMCAINCILTSDPAPIEFEDGEVYYDTALVDVRSLHRVSARPYDRKVFRITFQDENTTFKNVYKWLR